MGQVSLPGRMTMGSVGQSFVGVAGRKAMSHDFAVGADTQNSIRELPSLSGTSLPHGGRRPVKAQDDKLTVPSLAVNSGVIYRIRGVIGAVGVYFVIDTGAAVSLACPKGRLGTNCER